MKTNQEWTEQYVTPWNVYFRKFLLFSFLGTIGLLVCLKTDVLIFQLTGFMVYLYGAFRYAVPVFQVMSKEFKEIISEKH